MTTIESNCEQMWAGSWERAEGVTMDATLAKGANRRKKEGHQSSGMECSRRMKQFSQDWDHNHPSPI